MPGEIDLLKEQIAFAHQRIERLTHENWEFRILIKALMFYGENHALLIKEIQHQKELFLSTGLASPIPDSDIAFLEKAANRAISALQARLGENS